MSEAFRGELAARAAAALARGDALSALTTLAGDESADALALRGIALAQLGQSAEALELLDRARSAFAAEGATLAVARVRAARAEVLAAERELGEAARELEGARDELEGLGDARNAAWARLLLARLRALTGDAPRARAELDSVASLGRATEDAPLLAGACLARAEALARELRAREAAEALELGLEHARAADHAPLARELANQLAGLRAWRARLETGGVARALDAFELETLLRDGELVLDGLRRRLRVPGEPERDLAGRSTLFELLLHLARAWPGAVGEAELVRALFEAPEVDDSHRARLETDLARLRRELGPASALGIAAAGRAWRLETGALGEPRLVLPATGGEVSALEALLWDGAAWSARALAAATGLPLRTAQRRLAALIEAGRARSLGGTRSTRYARVDPGLGFAPRMFVAGLGGWARG